MNDRLFKSRMTFQEFYSPWEDSFNRKRQSLFPLEETYANAEPHETLIIKLKDVSMVDLSGAYALEDLVDNAKKNGKNVLICSAPPHVMKVLNSVKALDRVEQRNYFEVINDAVSMAKELSVEKKVCLR